MKFNPPKDFTPIKQRYRVESETTSEPKKWTKLHIKIFRTADDSLVYEFGRNYSNALFEPFQQYQDGVWHDYALISPSYTTFQVLDLESGSVIAERGFPLWKQSQEEYYTRLGKESGYKVGEPVKSAGFCPVDFYVPDLVTAYNFKSAEQWDKFFSSVHNFAEEFSKNYSGQFGFYSGCVWGDDSSWKLRYIDLSKISEGIVTDEEKFGYWELPDGKLSSHIEFDSDYMRLSKAEIVYL